MTQANHITVVFGSLTVDVPRELFKGRDCEIVPEVASSFGELLTNRYPWLNTNSLDVLFRKARMEMIRVRDVETSGRSHSAALARDGKLDDAIAHIRLHMEMEPENADLWFTLGELLCKKGDVAEGYKALNKGREMSLNNQRRGR